LIKVVLFYTFLCFPGKQDYSSEEDQVAHQTHTNSTTLRMKTEMVFEMSVSTKAEPHYPAENLKELLH
jgi:hypothetical protein